jgi:hypothetical protein
VLPVFSEAEKKKKQETEEQAAKQGIDKTIYFFLKFKEPEKECNFMILHDTAQ